MRSFSIILFAALSACLVRAARHCDGASEIRNDNNKFAAWKGVESNWTCTEGLCAVVSRIIPRRRRRRRRTSPLDIHLMVGRCYP
jgi:hypothetical protein